MSGNLISHISEPKRLILAWQAQDSFKDRTRFAVGELTSNGGSITLRYFQDDSEFAALNPNKDYQLLKSYGYQGYPGFSLEKLFHHDGVLEAFMRRLPPRSRPDFAAYKAHLRVADDIELSDFALLSLSEANLPSDGFSVVDPITVDSAKRELVCEVAGFRYYALKAGAIIPVVGDEIDILPEPDNEFDPNAVGFFYRGEKVGNVNRLQAASFKSWVEAGRINAVADRLNGRADRPRLFVFVCVAAKPDN